MHSRTHAGWWSIRGREECEWGSSRADDMRKRKRHGLVLEGHEIDASDGVTEDAR